MMSGKEIKLTSNLMTEQQHQPEDLSPLSNSTNSFKSEWLNSFTTVDSNDYDLFLTSQLVSSQAREEFIDELIDHTNKKILSNRNLFNVAVETDGPTTVRMTNKNNEKEACCEKQRQYYDDDLLSSKQKGELASVTNLQKQQQGKFSLKDIPKRDVRQKETSDPTTTTTIETNSIGSSRKSENKLTTAPAKIRYLSSKSSSFASRTTILTAKTTTATSTATCSISGALSSRDSCGRRKPSSKSSSKRRGRRSDSIRDAAQRSSMKTAGDFAAVEAQHSLPLNRTSNKRHSFRNNKTKPQAPTRTITSNSNHRKNSKTGVGGTLSQSKSSSIRKSRRNLFRKETKSTPLQPSSSSSSLGLGGNILLPSSNHECTTQQIFLLEEKMTISKSNRTRSKSVPRDFKSSNVCYEGKESEEKDHTRKRFKNNSNGPFISSLMFADEGRNRKDESSARRTKSPSRTTSQKRSSKSFAASSNHDATCRPRSRSPTSSKSEFRRRVVEDIRRGRSSSERSSPINAHPPGNKYTTTSSKKARHSISRKQNANADAFLSTSINLNRRKLIDNNEKFQQRSSYCSSSNHTTADSNSDQPVLGDHKKSQQQEVNSRSSHNNHTSMNTTSINNKPTHRSIESSNHNTADNNSDQLALEDRNKSQQQENNSRSSHTNYTNMNTTSRNNKTTRRSIESKIIKNLEEKEEEEDRGSRLVKQKHSSDNRRKKLTREESKSELDGTVHSRRSSAGSSNRHRRSVGLCRYSSVKSIIIEDDNKEKINDEFRYCGKNRHSSLSLPNINYTMSPVEVNKTPDRNGDLRTDQHHKPMSFCSAGIINEDIELQGYLQSCTAKFQQERSNNNIAYTTQQKEREEHHFFSIATRSAPYVTNATTITDPAISNTNSTSSKYQRAPGAALAAGRSHLLLTVGSTCLDSSNDAEEELKPWGNISNTVIAEPWLKRRIAIAVNPSTPSMTHRYPKQKNSPCA